MRRAMYFWVTLGLLVVAAGCSMCAHQYDDCGPVYDQGCASCGARSPRAGSAFGGAMGDVVSGQADTVAPTTGQPTPATAGVPVPGETIVGPEMVIGDTVIQPAPQPAAQPAPAGATWRTRPSIAR